MDWKSILGGARGGGWSAVAAAALRLVEAWRASAAKKRKAQEDELAEAEFQARLANLSMDADWIHRAGIRLRNARKACGLPPDGD